jgi:hypothetical protein
VAKSHPKRKFNRVDLPELCGPIIVKTKQLSGIEENIFFMMSFGI